MHDNLAKNYTIEKKQNSLINYYRVYHGIPYIYIENPKIENVFVSSSSAHFSIYKGHFKTH